MPVARKRLELTVANDMNHILPLQLYCRFACHGPVKNALFCLPGNQRLPLQATAGSHLRTTGYHGKELPVPKGWNSLVANVGTTGYHCKELPVPRGWNLLVPNLGTIGYHCKELPVPRS